MLLILETKARHYWTERVYDNAVISEFTHTRANLAAPNECSEQLIVEVRMKGRQTVESKGGGRRQSAGVLPLPPLLYYCSRCPKHKTAERPRMLLLVASINSVKITPWDLTETP